MSRPSLVITLIVLLVGIFGGIAVWRTRSKTDTPAAGMPQNAVTTSALSAPEARYKIYTNTVAGVEFQYPAAYIPYLRDNEYMNGVPERYIANPQEKLKFYDTFMVNLTGMHQPGVTDQSIDTVANEDIYHILRPFGENPVVSKLVIDGQEARIIYPAEKSPTPQRVELLVRLQKPVAYKEGDFESWSVFLVTSDGTSSRETIDQIARSFHVTP